MQYTTRQQQIINHFQKVYTQFGRNADTYSICVFASDETGFIYPQEIEELVAMGCEFFSVTYPVQSNMWTTPKYLIHKAIVGFTNNNKAQYEVACWYVRFLYHNTGIVVTDLNHYDDYYRGFRRTAPYYFGKNFPEIAQGSHIWLHAVNAWQNNPMTTEIAMKALVGRKIDFSDES